jgi:hypothetical protein
MGKGQRQCLHAILEETFKVRLPVQYLAGKNSQALFGPFGETYLQDSTIISLPDGLSHYYKGSVSGGTRSQA